ncbi:DUF2075 domain-containing protein [Leptolyngbya sp. 15MV]|nr:DUF2075 domain-containing protein [Leptolyngbya sp. 15MV]
MQQLTLGWKGPAIYSFHLRDLKNGIADGNEILKLLGERAVIREQQPSDIYDLRSGSAMGIGIAGCLLEDTNEMASLLSGDNRVAVTAMLACARLLRLPLSVSQVAPLLKSSDKRLAEAAERYLESEDSKEARTAIYALYPNSARITGATTLFASKPVGNPWTDALNRVFSSVSPYYASSYYASSAAAAEDFSSVEEKLRKEVLDDEKLLGVYNYGAYYLRIYADRITFAVQEDASRYRERAITQEEFDHLRNYLTRYRVDELPPFLACPIGCESRQLLMLGRQGGRRVFVKANRMPEFFKGLDQYFAQLAEGKLSLKYEASKELPGLEVLYANEGLSVETVWKKGDDIRIFVMNRSVRERVDKEIENELAKMTSAIEELRADGLGVQVEDVAHWFLKRWPDVRASDALETFATEYDCQGLELDVVGLAWGGDLLWQRNAWLTRRFVGHQWQAVRNAEERRHILNTYRVLLTRARYETVIWVPRGSRAGAPFFDSTREASELDAMADLLLACGASPLGAMPGPLPAAPAVPSLAL